MNFAAKLLLLALFAFASVNQVFAQKPEVDSYELRIANPSYFREYACNFFLDDRVVTVTLDDQSVLSGKIERIGSEDFSIQTDSGPVEARFDRVRRLSSLTQPPSPARQARKQAIHFHTDKPKFIVHVKLRQNGRGGPSSPSVQGEELVGRITRADELTFVLKQKDSGPDGKSGHGPNHGIEREIDYRDVQRISPTWEEIVLDGFTITLQVLGVILLWPLAMLTGMDC